MSTNWVELSADLALARHAIARVLILHGDYGTGECAECGKACPCPTQRHLSESEVRQR